MSKNPHHNLFRSSDNSYVNLFRPYLRDSNIYLDRKQFQRPTKKRRPIVARTKTGSKESSSTTTTCGSCCKTSSSDSLRALSFNVLPIWRYSSNAGRPLQEASEHANLLKHECITCCSMQKKKLKHHHHHHQRQLSKDVSVSVEHMPELLESKASMLHHELPVFEVLPPLVTNSRQNLVYENTYLLDGIHYDFNTCRRTKGYGKLTLDYIKYLKSITAKTKPTDQDVVFGNAKVLRTNSRGWDNSRIGWLLDLERRQELRKKRRLQRKLPLQRSDSFVDLCCFPFTRNLLVWNFN